MKIGIFLGYGPQVKLGKEGLGRYLGGLLKGFQEQGHDLTVVCPFWLKDTLSELEDSFFINKNKIKIVTDANNPPLWSIYKYLFLTKSKPRLKRIIINIIQSLKRKLYYTLEQVAISKNSMSFALWLIVLIVYVLACFFIIIPFLCVPGIFFLIKVLLKKMLKLCMDNVRTSIVSKDIIKSRIKKIFYSTRSYWYSNPLDLHLFHRMSEEVLSELVAKVNKSIEVDVWFVPAMFWPQVNNINGTVVINAPDLVTQDFPQGFADIYNVEYATTECRKTLDGGKFFITYCEYLRKTLLINRHKKNPDATIAIMHANNSMSEYLQVNSIISDRFICDFMDVFAKQLLVKYINEEVKYIFYASQLRPHKNMMNFIKAYRYLLREKFIGHKLLVTASLLEIEEVNAYIIEHSLQNDVISINNIPAQSLAALYHCADLVVNPTLYEGGFPFTFGEGMSVGTPSVMSDIPQVREVLEPAGLEEIMFDPYDWKAMANKIEWALNNLDELYEKELPLYEKMARRTYSVVADEYVRAFENFIQIDKASKK